MRQGEHLLWPLELKLIMRTSEPTASAVLSSVGIRILVSKAWPMWLMPNWISYPSFDSPGGRAMTPALFIRMSRRWDSPVNFLAASRMDSNDERSSLRNVTGTDGLEAWMSAMSSLRPAT